MLEHQGMRWGYVFLRGASHVSNEEMAELMTQAVEMYLYDEDDMVEFPLFCFHSG